MSGYSLVIEISDLQQFLNVEEEAFNGMIRNCARSLNNTAESEPLIAGSFIIFNIDKDNTNSRAVFESAVSILNMISENAEDIHEFSMMLLVNKRETEDQFITRLKQEYHLRCIDSGLLVDEKIASEVETDGDSEAVRGFRLFRAEDEGNDLPSNKSALMISDETVNNLKNFIVPDIEDKYFKQRVIVKYGSDLLLRGTVETALQKSAEDNSSGCIVISILKDEQEVIMPFSRSLDRVFLDEAEEYLSGLELETWKDVSGRLELLDSDYPEASFFIPFCIYLKAYIRKMKDSIIPPVILLVGTEHAPEGFYDYFLRILEIVSSETPPFLITAIPEESDIDGILLERFSMEKSDVFSCIKESENEDKADQLFYINKKMLFTLKLTEGLFEGDVQKRLLKEAGYSFEEIDKALRELEDSGYILAGNRIEVMHSEVTGGIFDDISGIREIYKRTAQFITKSIGNSEIKDYALVCERLKEAAEDTDVAITIFSALSRLLELGRIKYTDRFLDNCPGLPDEIKTALKLRCRLLSADIEGGRVYIDRVPDGPDFPGSITDSVLLLEAARYFHAVSDYQRALDNVKKVLIFVQEFDYPKIEGEAFLELGSIMMAKGKLLESAEYLALAVEKLTPGGGFALMKSLIFSAFGQYLWGAYDKALDVAEQAVAAALKGGFENWYFYVEFFKCRLYFELGRYYDAEKLLAGCLLRNEKYGNPYRRKLFSAWAARACIYQGKVYRAISMLKALEQDPEVLFFLAEAYYFSGNMEQAEVVISKAAGMSNYFELGFNPLEYISWKNGYVSLEGRFLRSGEGTGVLLHNIRATQAFIMGLAGKRDQGIEILFNLTRDQKISENDPYNRLYFYYYCLLLDRGNDPDIVDKLTLISKALKYLQQTSSRINTPSVRQEFMMKSYWNARLVEEAKREKLI